MTPLAELLRERPVRIPPGGKDESGTVVVVGGPPGCPGAPLLCGTAALRVGAGRIQVVVHPEVRAASAAAAWELWVEGWDQASDLPDAVRLMVAAADVVVVGPGHHELGTEVVEALAEATPGAVVLDAGALPATGVLAGRPDLVLAPNTAEAVELLGEPGDEPVLAPALSALVGGPVAVRGAETVVADATGCWAFSDAPAGLGTPGSGDVLVGVLAGLLAGGNDPLTALAWATVLHADAGRLAADGAPAGYLASEVAACLPAALAPHVL